MLRYTALIVFLLSIQVLCGQSLSFSEAAPLPVPKSAMSSAQAEGQIYVVNGFSESEQFTGTVHRFDVQQDAWDTLTNTTVPKRFASSAIVGDYLYIFGGVASGNINPLVEQVDLRDGTVTQLNPHPNPVTNGGVATWNNRIYLFGGSLTPSTYSDQLLVFDPAVEAWDFLASMPRTGQVQGEIVDGKLYLLGGYNGTPSTEVNVYNIATDTWETTYTMPVAISAHATAVNGTDIYLVGDFANLTSLARFDTETKEFTTLSSNLNPRRHCAAETVDGALYAIGGNTESNITSSVSSVQRARVGASSTVRPNAMVLTAYPNPAQDRVQLDRTFALVQVFDAAGVLVRNVEHVDAIGVDELPPGTYTLIATDKGEVLRTTIVRP